MKQRLLFLAFLSLAGAVANDVPNNSFEYDIQPVWNRMPSENIQPGKKTEYTYSSDSVSGKRSLLLNGQKLETAYESSARFRSNSGIFALKMKAPEGPVTVKVRCQFFLNTTHDTFIEKTFKVTGQWKTYELRTHYPFGRFRRSGMIIGPTKVIIDPGKGKVLVDDLLLSDGKRTPKKIIPGPVGGVPEKEMPLVPYIPLPQVSDFGKGKCGADTREFRFFPAKGGAEKNVFVSGVMLYPQSKVFFNSGSFALYDGTKKLAARFYPIAAWPQDKSLAALKVEFTADTADKVKTLQLRFTPGKGNGSLQRSPAGIVTLPNGVRFDTAASEFWQKNGSLGKAVLEAVDYTGKRYTFKVVSNHFENGTFLRRGKMLSADGMALGTVELRLRSNAPRAGVELDIAVANTSRKFVLIKELFWQCDAPGNKEALQRSIYGDHGKNTFKETAVRGGKKSEIIYKGSLEKLPSFTLADKQGVSVHVFNGTQTFPNELTFAPGRIKGALWPASAKVLSLAPGMTLRKKFLVSPEALWKTPDHPATVMPSAKAFAEAKMMIPVCPADPEKYPIFENIQKGSLGRLSPERLHEKFCYGQFNYGDHPGDGGWGNLESFEDYVLYHRAMREENPRLFRLAQAASRHYGDIDTDIRKALPHIHSANHIIGGNGFGHAWIPGIMSAWLLTGDAAFYQTARRMLDACIKLPLTSGEIQQGRNFGFFLLTLAEGYAIFNDPAAVERYMAQLNYQIGRYKNAPSEAEQRLQRTSIPRQNSLFYVTSSGLVPFHCWYGLTAFLKMYKLTGDPLIRQQLDKEFANIMDLEMTYRPQIETHWPGLPAEKLFPTIATDYLFGRGAFFYPVLAMYAEVSGKKEFLDLAIDTLYCGVLASRNAGNIQDVFMASPLAGAGKDFNEKAQISKIRNLLWQGAAPALLNGDFSSSLPYCDLVIPKKGIGTPRYPDWALKKPYPRNWHFVEGKQIISSMFMTYRGYYYTLDNKEYGKAAPSLRLDMTTKRYFSSGDLNSAKFRMEPGEWEVAVSVKEPGSAAVKQLGMRIMAFGKYSAQISVVPAGNKVIPDKKSSDLFKLYALSSRDTGKPGWKRISFRFRLKEKALGYFRMVYGMLPKAKEAHIHLDDVEIKRIGN